MGKNYHINSNLFLQYVTLTLRINSYKLDIYTIIFTFSVMWVALKIKILNEANGAHCLMSSDLAMMALRNASS